MFIAVFRLRDFSEWGQCQVMDLLKNYKPASEDEMFDFLVSICDSNFYKARSKPDCCNITK